MMSAPKDSTQISIQHLATRVGTSNCPVLIEGRNDEDFGLDSRLVPGSFRLSCFEAEDWAPRFEGQDVVVICDKGMKLSQGAVAWLRRAGVNAHALEGGFRGWRDAGQPVINLDNLPPRDEKGRTIWVTRARPKIDRIACPWLIRRFIDPNAVILYVKDSEVAGVAEKFGATPFDVDGVFWSHRGERCTFDTMIEEFGLTTGPLSQLADIVRGADTGRLDLAPESAGLLAISLGLSQQYTDDLAQLDVGMGVYDALYLRIRDAAEETHTWTGAA